MWYTAVHPIKLVPPLENSGTPWSIQHTRLTSIEPDLVNHEIRYDTVMKS